MPEHPTDAHFSFTFVFKQALSDPIPTYQPKASLFASDSSNLYIYS